MCGNLPAAEFWRAQLGVVLEDYDPGALSKLPSLLEKYEGREPLLYAKLCKKHGLDPTDYYGPEDFM